jgi:hypothetical protein
MESTLKFSQMCLKDIDHDYFTFFNLEKGELGSFSTYPEEWCSHYLSQNYDKHDYVHLKNFFLPVIWGQSVSKNISPIQKRIFKEAEDFHIYKGITVSFRTSSFPNFMTLAFGRHERLSHNKIVELTNNLQTIYQMIYTYQSLLEADYESKDRILEFIKEIVTWQKISKKKKLQKEFAVREILSDILSTQMFIAHHETKELGLETLHKIFRDIERLEG